MEPHPPREVIDLVSEDEDSDENVDWHDAYDDYEDEINFNEVRFDEVDFDKVDFDEPSLPAQHPAQRPAQHPAQNPEPHPPRHNNSNHIGLEVMPKQSPQERKNECFAHVYAVLPDVSPEHMEDWYLKRGGIENGNASSIANNIITSIFEEVEKGKPYPKREQISQGVKRKRELSAAEQAQQMYGVPGRNDSNALYRIYSVAMLASEFPKIPKNFVTKTLNALPTRHLFDAYNVLEEAERKLHESNSPPFIPLKGSRVDKNNIYGPRHLENTIINLEQSLVRDPSSPHAAEELKAAKELLAARKVAQEAWDQRQALKRVEEEELRNIKIAEREGTMKECGCCFGDHPLNRMVHCNSEADLHWFCRACAKQTVENVIGNSKYEITCMSMDGCDASFSRDQMKVFLDEKSFIALDRNEQEAVLRMAGIENLASCPFCPFAAEYPPVEVDKEFRCQAPDCQKVSCRLCKLETHIPKSCQEFARENGLSIRRLVEEAMTAALVRTCNKCKTPFVKELGCNKMTCMRNGCQNVQCYVCSKSCSYDHFDDASRGGRSGNCPLFENVETRHEEEVKKAEDEAIRKLLPDHPEYTENDLRVMFSENVKKDDERRKAQGPQMAHNLALHIPPYRGPGNIVGGVFADFIGADREIQAHELLPGLQANQNMQRIADANALLNARRNQHIQFMQAQNGMRHQQPGLQQPGQPFGQVLGANPWQPPPLHAPDPFVFPQAPQPLEPVNPQYVFGGPNQAAAAQQQQDGLFGGPFHLLNRFVGRPRPDPPKKDPPKKAEDEPRVRGGQFLHMAAHVMRGGRRQAVPAPAVAQEAVHPRSPIEQRAKRGAGVVVNGNFGVGGDLDDRMPSPNPARQRQRLF